MELETIVVQVAEPERNQVELWERHPAHPAGEVYLAGPGVFEVARTPAVEARLRNGRLVLVKPAVAPASATLVGDAVTFAEEEPETAAPDGDEPEAAAPKRARKGKGGL